MELPESLIDSSITRGVILHSTGFENIDHGKFFVIMGVNEDKVAGFFFINSNVHRSIYQKPEQLALQYPLKRSDYNFLDHDSFLCATQVLTLSKKFLCNSIMLGDTLVISNLRDDHVEEVLEMVRNSRVFSKIEKKQFFYE